MIDTADPEIIESLKYLLVSREEKMKMQAQPFDGKKNCWIPDQKEGFLPAEIQSTKGEEVTVKTNKGEVSGIFILLLQGHSRKLSYFALFVAIYSSDVGV